MERESDELLYDRYLKKRGEEDLRVLFSRHGKKLTLFLFGFVGDMRDAEELMLDAFAAAAAGKTPFFGKSSFKTWLYAIARHKALMFLRKKKVRTVPADELPLAGDPEADAALLAAERNAGLYRAMERLSADYRQVLFLLYFEEMSYEEIGRVTFKSRKQLYHLAERAKAALKKELEQAGFSGEML